MKKKPARKKKSGMEQRILQLALEKISKQADIMSNAIIEMKTDLKKEVFEYADQIIDAYRMGVCVRGEWCCENFRLLMTHHVRYGTTKIGADIKPDKDKLRRMFLFGIPLNFCPYCGTKT